MIKFIRPLILGAIILFCGVFLYQRFIAARDYTIIGVCEAYGSTGPAGGTCTPMPTIPVVKETVDRQASFAIVTNGTFRVFTQAMYHNRSPDVFIQSDNPNVVHLTKRRVRWGDFFDTLPFNLTNDCLTTGIGQTFCTSANNTLKFYLNNIQDSDALAKEINKGDKLLVSFGPKDDTNIPAQLEKVVQVY